MKFSAKLLDKSSAGFSDRARVLALYNCIAGILVVVLIATVTVFTDSVTKFMALEVITHLSLFSILGVLAFKEQGVKKALNVILTSVYLAFWCFAFLELIQGNAQIISLALTLFVPLFLIISLNYKLIMVLAPLQMALIYIYYTQYGIFLGNEGSYIFAIFPKGETALSGLPVVCTIVSGLSFLMHASVSYIRYKKDLQLVDLIDKNRFLASTDDLTGLTNRRAFVDMILKVWEEGEPFVLAYVDLDRFKPINDQFGHAAGDEVLRHFAARMSSSPHIRSAARLGGDEFAVILKNGIGVNEAQILIPQIHKDLLADIATEFGLLNVGCSIGYVVAQVDVHKGDKIIPAAEHAMRRAKTNKFGWARFCQTKDSSGFSISSLEREFKQALQAGNIRAAIQPIYSTQRHDVMGYELLARWINSSFPRDPNPNEFIPVAEKMGLLDDVLWQTLEEVLKNVSLEGKYLALNISPSQILSIDFIKILCSFLDQYKVPYNSITLEITEQLAFRNLDENVQILERARELGMSVAMDDFGTGYASLSVLGALPLTKLKVDQSLLVGLKESKRKKSILKTVINMSNQLGLTCCVEGIETSEMATFLKKLGVDELQGYWLGRPNLVKDQPAKIRAA